MTIRCNNRKGELGIALIMVMIIILTLSALVGGFAYVMKVEMTLARNSDYDNDMVWMGRSGVELAKFAVTLHCGGQNVDALTDKWAGGTQVCHDNLPDFPFGENADIDLLPGKIKSIKVTDMSAKFDINMVVNPSFPQNVAILQSALNQMGVTDTSLSQTIIDSIQDWVGPRDQHAKLSGAKDDYYLSQEPPYYCKCGWIDDINELLLVKGIKDHPEIFWGSNSTNHTISAYDLKAQNSPFLRDREQPNYPFGLNDVFCAGGQQLNINTAPINILKILFNGDESMAEEVQHQRAGYDGVDGTEDDAPLTSPGDISRGAGAPAGPSPIANLQSLVGVRSSQFEVRVVCDINGYSKEFISILRRDPRSGQFQVLQFYWK